MCTHRKKIDWSSQDRVEKLYYSRTIRYVSDNRRSSSDISRPLKVEKLHCGIMSHQRMKRISKEVLLQRHILQAVEPSQNYSANCIDISRLQQWGPHLPIFLGKPAMRTRWMAGIAAHKNGRSRDKSRSDNHTQTNLDLRFLP